MEVPPPPTAADAPETVPSSTQPQPPAAAATTAAAPCEVSPTATSCAVDEEAGAGDRRVVVCGDHADERYPDNGVSNTKYTILTFLPLNIFEQFSRPVNAYFLFVALLQFISIIAPVNPLTTLLPLAFAFTLTAVKDGLDDYARWREDEKFNTREYRVLQAAAGGEPARWVPRPSRDICVGDVVLVREDAEIPCDMVLLASADATRLAYLRTDNLDGEVGLKTRECVDVGDVGEGEGDDADAEAEEAAAAAEAAAKGLDATEAAAAAKAARFAGAHIRCEKPNDRVFHFSSTMRYAVAGGEEVVRSLSSENLLLQSCFLKNTAWVCGTAVYTGGQTKCGVNKKTPPVKIAGVDRKITKLSLFVFASQIALTIVIGIIGNGSAMDKSEESFYLAMPKRPWYHPFLVPLRFFLLTSVMIPISFKVIVDVSKYYLSLLIGWDAEMYEPTVAADEGGCPARANNTAIAEDLGQIQTVMTDKTGTLTENIMVLKACSVGGRLYGHASTTVAAAAEASAPGVCEDLRSRAAAGDEAVRCFVRALALCHEVEASCHASAADAAAAAAGGEAAAEAPAVPRYSAVSPDEEALVRAAAEAGCEFVERNRATGVRVRGGQGWCTAAYDVLHTLPFTSDRKMMSALLRCKETGVVELLSKGADDKMLLRAGKGAGGGGGGVTTEVEEALRSLASEGLRTLVFGRKEVSAAAAEEWVARHRAVLESTVGEERDRAVEALYDEMERGFTVVGVSGIEDRLQAGVPETIQVLREAGISFWMLTGDKFETARQIARLSGLWKEGEAVVRLRSGAPSQIHDDVHAHLRDVGGHGCGDGCDSEGDDDGATSEPGEWTALGSRRDLHQRRAQQRQQQQQQQQQPVTVSAAGPTAAATSSAPQSPYGTFFRKVCRRCGGGGSKESSRRRSSSNGKPAGGGGGGGGGFVLMLDGRAVSEILEHVCAPVPPDGGNAGNGVCCNPQCTADAFHALCFAANSVVCCRVSPSQKAALTRLARREAPPVAEACDCRCGAGVQEGDGGPDGGGGGPPGVRRVLSIGDGGNDVMMIQEATIGVGVVGKEGRQASRAADYVIGRFRFLRPLLLVHGHYSYARSSWIVQYCFYKSMLLAAVQVMYNPFALLCGQTYWNSMMLATWNGVFTLPPPFLFVLDKIVPRRALLCSPQLYQYCQQGLHFTTTSFVINLLEGIFHAVVSLGVTLIVVDGYAEGGTGRVIGLQEAYTTTFTMIIFMQAWVVFLQSNTLTVYNIVGILAMPPLYIACMLTYSAIKRLSYYGTMQIVLTSPLLLLSILFVTVALCVPRLAWHCYRHHVSPTPLRRAQLAAVRARRAARAAVNTDEQDGDGDVATDEGSPLISPTAGLGADTLTARV